MSPEAPLPRRRPTDSTRGEWVLACACILCGLIFFASLQNLWPLARTDLVVPSAQLRRQALDFLTSAGHDLEGYRAADLLLVHTDGLNYVERYFGRERAQEWIAAGLPLVYYRAQFKKRGETIVYSVTLHPAAGVIGWDKRIDEDYPGPRLPVDEARELAAAALAQWLGLDPDAYEERSASTSEQIERTTHVFGYERVVQAEPELRERVRIAVGGDAVTSASRRLIVPDEARRAARAAEAPRAALEMVGFAAVAAFGLLGFVIFLKRLQGGGVRLGRASVWPALVFVCLLGTHALQTADLFWAWEPLWPRWVSALRYLVFSAIGQSWLMLVLLAVVAAGDAVDRESGAGRGDALRKLGRGQLLDPGVVRASWRGFLIGLLCGGAMSVAIWALQATAGAETAIQPRGFFFYTLNTAAPALTSLLFFFGVALAEELGYRYYAGGWLMARTGRRWLAVLLPAVVYGLTHTNLSFLPPAEPFWARPLVLTLVGCVWGWAFFRYDALTVVLSHFTADLFIFNWPRLASGRGEVVAVAALTVAAPLVPAILGFARRRR